MRTSSLLNRNVVVDGRRTSMKLEPMLWDALDEICRRESISVHALCTMVGQLYAGNPLTGAMRMFIVSYFRAAATDLGHVQAGHGGVHNAGQGAESRSLLPNALRHPAGTGAPTQTGL